jgi:hypothetical protein
MKLARHAARMGEINNYMGLIILVGKSERKRPLERPRRRVEDNIKMDLKEIGCTIVDWIHLDIVQWRAVVKAVMNI